MKFYTKRDYNELSVNVDLYKTDTRGPSLQLFSYFIWPFLQLTVS